jgi:4-amino-4-deoxychorismate lyase
MEDNPAKPLFLESIKVRDGEFFNLELHEERILRTCLHFGIEKDFSLRDLLPKVDTKGLMKLRLVYPFYGNPPKIELIPYNFPIVSSLLIICDDSVSYPFKSLDRDPLTRLKERAQSSGADDFILCVNGMVTDASIANLVFAGKDGLFTPKTCLLEGVKRQALLRSGKIKEYSIDLSNISDFFKVFFINALIDLEDDVSVPIPNGLIRLGKR